MTMTFKYRSYIPILSNMEVEKNSYYITPSNEAPPSHPKVVPWDQVFFLLKSPLYIVDFRHMNRGHFPNKAKSGKPAAHRFRTNKIRFWGTFRYISAKMLTCGPLGKRRPGLTVYIS